MKIPHILPWLGGREAEAARRTILENWITEGPKTKEFGEKLNTLLDVQFGVFAPNGTLALTLGLLALGIGSGDEVIVPDITFVASANAVMLVGAKPVFAEVNARNFQIDISSCRKLIGPKTRGIMPVHLYGMAADMDAVMKFAKKNNLKVIEDAAQAVGVFYKGKHAGTFGDVGCFSFFADKTITTGEGGYVVCKDRQIYENLLYLRNQGRLKPGTFVHPQIGFNFRITDIQAAIGLVQLAKLKTIIKKKQKILNWYQKNLENVSEVKFLELEPGSTYVPFRMVLICEKASLLMEYLNRNGVGVRTFFYPLHRQPCFSNYALDDENYPNAIYGYEHGICLPLYPLLTENQVAYISRLIGEFYQHQT